jgi:Zn ribbon nucleic-acid-binding protein
MTLGEAPMRPKQSAECIKCGHVAPLRAFEVEVALSADDSGDNDWVINYACPACEAADVLAAEAAPGRQPALGPRANQIYDPHAP